MSAHHVKRPDDWFEAVKHDEVALDRLDREWSQREMLARSGVLVPEPLTVDLSCISCPEQWDVYLGGEQVGYLRLRHSHFTVRVPDAGGELLYQRDYFGHDGRYQDAGDFDDEDRGDFLNPALAAVARWVLTRVSGALWEGEPDGR